MINEMKQYNYIYLITNLLNNKIYVGKHHTDNLDDGYMGSGKIIKLAIAKYGIENFTKEYLAFCDTEEKLNWLEKFYIKKYKAREAGYNLTDGGDGVTGLYGTKNPMYGVHRCGEYAPNYGKHHSAETKQKMSKARIGLHWNLSEETKQKMKNSWTEERKQKMSKTKIGLHYNLSEETKQKMCKPKSEETKQKMKNSWTEERKQKIRDGVKRYWSNKN